MKINLSFVFFLVGIFMLLHSCNESYTPKPKGYFRIDMPEKHYTLFDSTFPYTFEYPVYAELSPDHEALHEKYWVNLNYPAFKGSLHISYKEVDNNLVTYLEDARTLVVKHIPKASAINDSLLINRDKQVFGLIYEIKGAGAASPYQFFLTDSVKHFLRGALYFNIPPNNDSMAPVIDFLEKDIAHMINTFRWKETANK